MKEKDFLEVIRDRERNDNNHPYLFRNLEAANIGEYVIRALNKKISEHEEKNGITYEQNLGKLVKQSSEQKRNDDGLTPIIVKLMMKEGINDHFNQLVEPLIDQSKRARDSENLHMAKDLATRCVDMALAIGQVERAIEINQSLNIYHDMVAVYTKAESEEKFGEEAVTEWASIGKRSLTLCLANVAFGDFDGPRALQKYLSYFADLVSVQDALIIATKRLGWNHPQTLFLHKRWMGICRKESPETAKLVDLLNCSLEDSKKTMLGSLPGGIFDPLTAYRLVICTKFQKQGKLKRTWKDFELMVRLWAICHLRSSVRESLILSENIARDITERTEDAAYMQDIFTFFTTVFKLVLGAHEDNAKDCLTSEITELRHLKVGRFLLGGLKYLFGSPAMVANAILKQQKDEDVEIDVEKLSAQMEFMFNLLDEIRKGFGDDAHAYRFEATLFLARRLAKIFLGINSDEDISSLHEFSEKTFSKLSDTTRKNIIEFISKDEAPFEAALLNERFKTVLDSFKLVEEITEVIPVEMLISPNTSAATADVLTSNDLLALLKVSNAEVLEDKEIDEEPKTVQEDVVDDSYAHDTLDLSPDAIDHDSDEKLLTNVLKRPEDINDETIERGEEMFPDFDKSACHTRQTNYQGKPQHRRIRSENSEFLPTFVRSAYGASNDGKGYPMYHASERSKTCYNCGRDGHVSRDCRSGRPPQAYSVYGGPFVHVPFNQHCIEHDINDRTMNPRRGRERPNSNYQEAVNKPRGKNTRSNWQHFLGMESANTRPQAAFPYSSYPEADPWTRSVTSGRMSRDDQRGRSFTRSDHSSSKAKDFSYFNPTFDGVKPRNAAGGFKKVIQKTNEDV